MEVYYDSFGGAGGQTSGLKQTRHVRTIELLSQPP